MTEITLRVQDFMAAMPDSFKADPIEVANRLGLPWTNRNMIDQWKCRDRIQIERVIELLWIAKRLRQPIDILDYVTVEGQPKAKKRAA